MARKRKTPRRDKKTGKFLTRRQIAARKRSRSRKRSTTKKRKRTMPKKKRRRRRGGSRRGGLSTKQKQEVCLASAALGYVEENTELTKDLPFYKPDAAGNTSSPAKRHLAYGLGLHFLGKKNKWLDRASTALLVVGAFEAGQSKLSLEGGSSSEMGYDVVEVVEGDVDVEE